jgi:hypothetical protein
MEITESLIILLVLAPAKIQPQEIVAMPRHRAVSTLTSPSGLLIYHKGPPFEEGPLPAFFYFALSGEESLALDPYNQPVAFLEDIPIRTFSFTIPFHGPEFEKSKAMEEWSRAIRNHQDFLKPFVQKSLQNIQYLIELGYVDEQQMMIGGLSRGAFIATHIAAEESRLKTLVGFAPLTQLTILKEFHDLQDHPLVQVYSLLHLIPKCIDKHLRFYIGNRDLRVGTTECFQFIKVLADSAYEKGVRSPHAELVINPSVGHQGHGTLPYIFKDGVQWLLNKDRKFN